jgi:hypothetical protein
MHAQNRTVFRTNSAHARYWEMRSSVATMSARWASAAALALAYEHESRHAHSGPRATTPPPTAAPPAVAEDEPLALSTDANTLDARLSRASAADADEKPADEGSGGDAGERPTAVARPSVPPLQLALRVSRVYEAGDATLRAQALLVHRFSLMHALALQYLRRDNALELLVYAAPDAASIPFTPREASRCANGLGTPWARTGSATDDATQRYGCGDGGVWQDIFFGDRDDAARHETHLAAHPLPVLGGVDEAEKRALEGYNDRVGYVHALLVGQLNERRRRGLLGAVEAPGYSLLLSELANGRYGSQGPLPHQPGPTTGPSTTRQVWLRARQEDGGHALPLPVRTAARVHALRLRHPLPARRCERRRL